MVNKTIHLYGNADEWTRCGFITANIGAENITNNVEKCTCRDCLKYMMRDAMGRFLLIDDR